MVLKTAENTSGEKKKLALISFYNSTYLYFGCVNYANKTKC